MEAILALSPKTARGPVEVTASKVLTSEAKDRKDSGLPVREKEEAASIKKIQDTSSKRIDKIADAMDRYVRSMKRELKIRVHDESGKLMIQVISQEDGRVIREIPPKELLDLAAKMDEMAGTLLSKNV
jgi:flagellar protein FlaG